MIQNHLSTICEELSLAMPPLDKKKNSYSLEINPTISLTFTELNPGFSLFGIISPCPTKQREELFLYLMRANFLGQGTGGARLGLDPEEKSLTLSCSFPYEMKYQDFKEKLEDFANFLLYWRSEIEKFL